MGGLGGLETVPARPTAFGVPGAATENNVAWHSGASRLLPYSKESAADQAKRAHGNPLDIRADFNQSGGYDGERALPEAQERFATERRDEELARSLQIEEEVHRFEEIVKSVLADLQPTHSFQHRQNRLFQRLDRIFKELYGPKVVLEIFGSTVCNLAGKTSDLDMTFTPGLPQRLSLGEKKTVLRKVAKALQSSGMRAVPVLGARVPIIKITDLHDTWLAVDLSVENELPVFKSRLLNEYSLIDVRFSQLVLLVKAWAKARGINSAAHGTLNSFGLSLLVVHYLQHLDPPILPRLNEETIELRGDAARRRGIGSSGVSHARVQGECEGIVVRHHTHHDLGGWGTDNTRPISLLAHGFFRYFSREFDWSKHVVSITMRGPVLKSSVTFYQGQNTNLCIQDPLDQHDNCARSVGGNTYERVRDELERAFALDYEALLQIIRSAATRPNHHQREAAREEERRRKREQKMVKRMAKNAVRTAEDKGGNEGESTDGQTRGSGDNLHDCWEDDVPGNAHGGVDEREQTLAQHFAEIVSLSPAKLAGPPQRIMSSGKSPGKGWRRGVGAKGGPSETVDVHRHASPMHVDGRSATEAERRRQRELRFGSAAAAAAASESNSRADHPSFAPSHQSLPPHSLGQSDRSFDGRGQDEMPHGRRQHQEPNARECRSSQQVSRGRGSEAGGAGRDGGGATDASCGEAQKRRQRQARFSHAQAGADTSAS